MQTDTHRLAAVLDGAARGEFPAPAGTVEVLSPPPGPPAAAVVAFTGRYFIAASAPEDWVRDHLPEGDLLAPLSPRFLTALGEKLGLRDDGIDVVLAALGLPGTPSLHETTAAEHPRVTRANMHREHVRVFCDATGAAIVIIGRGLAHRTELAVEVESQHRGQGLAAQALFDARRLVNPHEPLFAQPLRATRPLYARC